MLQRVAVCAYVHLRLGPVSSNSARVGVLQRVAACCCVCVCASGSGPRVSEKNLRVSVLQRVAACCSVLQGVVNCVRVFACVCCV